MRDFGLDINCNGTIRISGDGVQSRIAVRIEAIDIHGRVSIRQPTERIRFARVLLPSAIRTRTNRGSTIYWPMLLITCDRRAAALRVDAVAILAGRSRIRINRQANADSDM